YDGLTHGGGFEYLQSGAAAYAQGHDADVSLFDDRPHVRNRARESDTERAEFFLKLRVGAAATHYKPQLREAFLQGGQHLEAKEPEGVGIGRPIHSADIEQRLPGALRIGLIARAVDDIRNDESRRFARNGAGCLAIVLRAKQ